MNVIWLCNMVPGAIRQQLGGSADGGLWVDQVLAGLRAQPEITLRILCLAGQENRGTLDAKTDFATFTEGEPYRYLPALEQQFEAQLREFSPDVIHIWGTEYGHTLAMVHAAEKTGMLGCTAISIQGLCGPISRHYAEGIPTSVIRGFTFRDLLRWDNIALQQRKFALRGELERQALERVPHIIGRTDWDRACTLQINPKAAYHFCNETLRTPFYEGTWRYASCKKHSVFASSYLFPLKGFHYLLEAMAIVRRFYPDATVSVTGSSIFEASLSARLRRDSYTRYLSKLCRRNDLAECVEFLGGLSADAMKQAYLNSNVFVLPSTVENSPNSLGEAMLLGVPCVAADVGGVANLLHPGEGFVYPSTAPYMLAARIMEVFAMEDRAEAMGEAARAHAKKTHNSENNLRDLLAVYADIQA